ncbi:nicotinamide adenine dinucleotide transporter 1-related [Anaeramoeba flamelloides]|uniref:Nicotinamide adenine dinucleotide transporter 1-related n=1 Tax=Anaeramoeba flamelloides TaxID=1746091 RepID=A0AAV7Z2M1_9EUKA|nr:nicotinamide adenine dinucleotide transporter 1-related [Anaeramoeba flamelloides]
MRSNNNKNYSPRKKQFHTKDPKEKQINPLISGLAGTSIPVISTVLTLPFDLAKTRMLTTKNKKKLGVVESLQELSSQGNVKVYWTGLTPTLLALLVNWSVYFTSYEKVKQFLDSHTDHKTGLNFFSSMVSGALSVSIGNPFWVAKTRMQSESHLPFESREYQGTIQTIKKIYYEEGTSSLFSGIGSSILGLANIAIYFPLYEKIKQEIRKRKRAILKDLAKANPQISGFQEIMYQNIEEEEEKKKLKCYELFLASAIAKTIASGFSYPNEVVRAKLQNQKSSKVHKNKNFFEMAKHIYENSGVSGFYTGFGANLLKVVPSNAISFTCYEFFSRYLHLKLN